MDDKDLENTRALNDLSDLVKKEDEKIIGPVVQNRETIETSEELYNNLTNDAEKKDETISEDNHNPSKKSFKDKWNALSKKKKTTIIIIAISIVIISIVVSLYFLTHKKNNEESQKDDVILAKDNYIYQNGVLTIIDDNNNPIGTYECTNKDEKLCYVAYYNNDEDQFETPINKYEDGTIIKNRSKVYLNKYVFIIDQSESTQDIVKLYNLETNETMGEYLGVKAANDSHANYVILKNKGNQYGLFELTDEAINKTIDFSYTYMGINTNHDDDIIVAKNNKSTYLINYDNKVKTKTLTGDIIDYNNSYIVIKNNNKYSIFDYNNQKYNSDYDYIRLVDDNHVAVVSDNNVYIKGVNENKYNEDGISLNNNNYVAINTYDANNKKIDTSFAFQTQVNNKVCDVTIHGSDGNTENNINLNEGDASSKYNYYNYFDGKLYFYSDDAKTKLIGTYTCNNHNEIGDDLTLKNCYIASDTVFNDTYVNPSNERNATIPMFNNRFLFIYDSPSNATDSNTEIKFYDLTQNKTLGTYSKIDSGTSDNSNEFKLISTSNTEIIGKLKSGKYGTIIISSTDAKVGYKFEYNYLERFGKYYLAQNENSKWQVIYSSETKSFEFDNKIMNINNKYAVVKVNDGVRIFKNNATQIIDKTYKYIEITDQDVFGVVDNSNGKLYIIKSDGTILNPDGLTLNTANYYNTPTPSFKIEVVGNNVFVSIYDGKAYSNKVQMSLTTDTAVTNNTSTVVSGGN
jgi:hypothetical protein